VFNPDYYRNSGEKNQKIYGRLLKPALPQTVFPYKGIYPAEKLIPRYGNIISGAGYNMRLNG